MLEALDEDLRLAHELVSLASEIALVHFERGPVARSKADGSQVTDADEEVERCLVERLRKARPRDAVLGEELGSAGSSTRCWILDPIDGTCNFVAASSQWGTHVALEDAGEIVLGVISRPACAKRWWAARGRGSFRSDDGCLADEPIRVSDASELRDSRVTFWAERPHPAADRLEASAIWVPPDLNAILDLAEGRLEAVVDPTGRAWDHAPAVVLVEEAGGTFSDAAGGRRIDQGEGRYSNGRVHRALVELLST